MTFSKNWMGRVALLFILLMVACANPNAEPLPTQAPINSIKEDEATDVTVEDTNSETVTEEPAEEGVNTDDGDAEGDEADEEVDDSLLVALPRLDQSQLAAGGPGLGGGGGGVVSEAESVSAADSLAPVQDLAIDFIDVDLFENTVFSLNTELPTGPGRAQVQQQSEFTISFEEAQVIAAQLGFTGALYQQPIPEGVEEIEFEPFNNIFFAFDENGRSLNMDAIGVYYSDSSFQYDAQPNLDFNQAGPLAEAFLQERGLLDFEYVIEKGWGNEVWFKRVIRGAPLNQPEITVGLTNDGNVLFMSMQRYDSLERLGNYPLQSAADAWTLLQSGVSENQIPFSYAPNFDDLGVVIEPPFPEDQYQYWQRTYQPGAQVSIFTWPATFVAADGVSAPRIEAYPFVLTGNQADLEAIAAQSFTQFRFEGIVSENGRFLEVTGWEAITDYPENLYLQGTVIIEDGQALFVADDGATYLLPDAPADIPEGERFNLFAWEARETDGPFPVIDWESIDVFIDYDEIAIEEPVILEDSLIYEPTVYESIQINEVKLVYFFAYIFPEFDEANPSYGPPTTVIKPVWQFTGEADNGDEIDFFVDAVAPEFIQ